MYTIHCSGLGLVKPTLVLLFFGSTFPLLFLWLVFSLTLLLPLLYSTSFWLYGCFTLLFFDSAIPWLSNSFSLAMLRAFPYAANLQWGLSPHFPMSCAFELDGPRIAVLESPMSPVPNINQNFFKTNMLHLICSVWLQGDHILYTYTRKYYYLGLYFTSFYGTCYHALSKW